MRRCLVALVLLVAVPAAAAPTIDVRARTRVIVEGVVRTGAGVHIRGTLSDAVTGEGIVGRHVLLEIDGGRRQVTTVAGPGGHFDAYVDVPAGTHEVAARFGGDESFGDSATVPRPYDVDKSTLSVEVRVEGPIDASAPEATARILVGSSEGPEIIPLVVRAGDAGSTSLRPIGAVTTDSRGEATVTLPRAQLGGPGAKRVLVRFEGSDVWNPAEAEATFLVQTSTRITEAHTPSSRVAYEDELVAGGRLVESDDQPVAKALVVLTIGGKPVHEAITDDAGRFELRVDAGDHGPGTVQLGVAYDSTLPWRRGTRLGPFPIEIARPEPVPLSYTLLTFALTAGAVVAYILLRTRPWVRLAAAVRRRRRKPAAATLGPPSSEEEVAPAPGLRLARPSFISALRRAADHGFTGRVADVVRGHPVGGARLVLVLTGPEGERRELVADADGRFETELPSGWWHVDVSAHGYVTESIRAIIPHRGELRGARIDLLPVRERVFAIYRQIAAPLLPKPELWGVWTPREILDHARAVRPDGAFGQLTSLVEETYFSVRIPDEAVVAAAQARASAAARELTA